MKWFKTHWWGSFTWLMVIFFLVTFLLATSQGLKLIVVLAHVFFPTSFSVTSVDGALIGPLQIKQLRLQTGKIELSIEQMDVDWDPVAIFKSEFHIKKLSLLNPHLIITTPNASTSEPLSLETIKITTPSFYRFIIIDTIKITGFDLQMNQYRSRIEGELSTNWDMKWIVDTINVNSMLKTLQGRVNATGFIKGPRLSPQILSKIQMENVILNNQHIQKLLIDSQIQTSLSKATLIKTAQFNIEAVQMSAEEYQIPKWNAAIKVITENNRYHGTVSASANTLSLPTLNLQLKNIQVDAQGNSLDNILLKAQANSGGGFVNLNGVGNLTNFKPTAKLKMTGKDVLISRTPRYQITATPNIDIQIDTSNLKLSGDISIPKARLLPMEVSDDIVSLPSDVVILGEISAANKPSEFNISTDINLLLEKHVTLQLLGLTGRLEGKLRITSAPQQPTLALGELSIVDGKYDAYQQKLIIRKGSRLSYTNSPLDDPLIFLQAYRIINTVLPNTSKQNFIQNTLFNTPASTTLSTPSQATDLLVGITVKGTVKNPQLSLFSEPATLSQADILAYLLLGQSLNDTSPSDAQLLMKAASALSPAGGQVNHIVQQIQQSIGLDELKIASIPQLAPGSTLITQNPSLVVGKRLSDRLYINYSHGLTAPLNILKISYLLGSKWKIQTESSNTANAVDLFYTIEKN